VDKSPDAFRTISEVAEDLQTPAHVLRFWESRFPQVRPVKRAGGRRYYRPSDVALLAGIRRLLHDEGMTIRGVQKVLREQGVRHVAGLSQDELAMADAAADQPADAGADWAEAGETDAPNDDAPQEVAPDFDPPLAPVAEALTTGPEAPAPSEITAEREAPPAPSGASLAEPLPPVAGDDTARTAHGPEPEPASPPPERAEPVPDPAPEPPPIADLPLFAGQGVAPPPPQMPRLAALPRNPSPDMGEDAETPTLAARLRALPPRALAHRNDEAASIRAALSDLHARLSDRARGPRR
jgi:DNA-binding transcriptional MerR regulator